MNHRQVFNSSAIRTKIWLVIILCFTFLGSTVLIPSHGLAASSVQQKQQELKGVQSQINSKKSRISKIKRQEKNVIQQLIRTEQELDKTQERLETLKAKRRKTEGDINNAAAELRVALSELDKAQRRLDGQVQILRKRLRAIYMRGAGDYLELLFSAKDFSDFVTRFDLLDKIVKQDIGLFHKVKAEKEVVSKQKERIEVKKAQLESKRTILKGIENNVSHEKVRISDKVQERESYLKEIRNKRELEEKSLDELEATAEQINSMITKLLANTKNAYTSTDKGKLSWPVQGKVTSPYGWRYHPIKHSRRFHYGIDISAPSGRPVISAKPGIVLFAGWQGGYGKTVIIDHGGGITTLYAHNSVLVVSVGKKVDRGQMIARVGSTGLSTGPHVHFEVRVGRSTQDPMGWLR